MVPRVQTRGGCGEFSFCIRGQVRCNVTAGRMARVQPRPTLRYTCAGARFREHARDRRMGHPQDRGRHTLAKLGHRVGLHQRSSLAAGAGPGDDGRDQRRRLRQARTRCSSPEPCGCGSSRSRSGARTGRSSTAATARWSGSSSCRARALSAPSAARLRPRSARLRTRARWSSRRAALSSKSMRRSTMSRPVTSLRWRSSTRMRPTSHVWWLRRSLTAGWSPVLSWPAMSLRSSRSCMAGARRSICRGPSSGNASMSSPRPCLARRRSATMSSAVPKRSSTRTSGFSGRWARTCTTVPPS